MLFGFIGISFLTKLKFQKVSYLLILLYIYIPDFIYVGLRIIEWYCINQFPPINSPPPAQWSHSLFVNGIIVGITTAIILIRKEDKSHLILVFLPIIHVLLDSFSIFYAVYYFFPFFEDINTLRVKGYYEYNEYLKRSYGIFTSGMNLWPVESFYWLYDFLTLLISILICIWRVAKKEFEEEFITKIKEHLIVPADYSLFYRYPKLESITLDENKIFTQEEWEDSAQKARDAINYFQIIKEEKLDLQYNYPEFKEDIPIVKKFILRNFEEKIKNIYIEFESDYDFKDDKVIVKSLKNPSLKKGRLFFIQVKRSNLLKQRELVYLSPNEVPIFINRGKDTLIKFNHILRNEEIRIEKAEQILRVMQLFVELFGCFRERILYSNQEIDRWKLYDYRTPELEYETEGLPINGIEIYQLKGSFGLNIWTWADHFSKWAIFFYQFQLFPDGFKPEVFPFYRIPIYSGMLPKEDKLTQT